MSVRANKKRVSVIVINQNGRALLEDCLGSLMKTLPAYAEAVLMDNASSDDSLAYAAAHFPQVRIIGFEKNQGFAGGYNQAIEQCDTEFIYLLNNDTELKSNWLEPLVELMDEQEDIGICSSRLLNYYNAQLIDHAGGLLSISGWRGGSAKRRAPIS